MKKICIECKKEFEVSANPMDETGKMLVENTKLCPKCLGWNNDDQFQFSPNLTKN